MRREWKMFLREAHKAGTHSKEMSHGEEEDEIARKKMLSVTKSVALPVAWQLDSREDNQVKVPCINFSPPIKHKG